MRFLQVVTCIIMGSVSVQTCLHGQTLATRDYAIEITAAVQETPPQITLNWRNNGDGLQYFIQRKLKDDTQWEAGIVLPADANNYVDASVTPGMSYEYSITQTPPPPNPVCGYILTGIKAPLIENRGRLILIVESSLAAPLAAELAQLQQDLVGDGWAVARHDVSRDSSPPEVKAIIQAEFQSDPANTRSAFLFGHVPVPYSGDYNADSHDDHTGAWVADTYYADMDGIWTDDFVFDTRATRPANRNVPGDGKFDQSTIPSDLELQVGRVDLANMPAFLPLTEIDLLRAYLNKDHQFRMGMLTEPRQGLIFDGFGASGGLAYAASGWRNFAPFFGSENVTEVGWNEFLPTVTAQGYLWSYAGGGGDPNYTDCYGVAQTSDFVSTQIRTVFMMFFGSYFGDWDATDCIFRAPLCSGDCLAVMWAGCPHWFLHPMALGETIGYCTRLTQNNSGTYLPTDFMREVHISLLGDPTLRMHVVASPASLVANANPGAAALSWAPSYDSDLQGYHIYRATDPNGPFQRMTDIPIQDLAYVDPVGVGTYTYMVRAVKPESSASGTYFNASQGVFATITVSGPATPVLPSNPQFSSGQFTFQCSGTAGQKFVIERSYDLNTWSPISTNTMTSEGIVFHANDLGASAAFYRTRLFTNAVK